MENSNQKFVNLVTVLQSLVETGNFVLDIQKDVRSTSYRTGSLEQALKRQVIEETVHDMDEDGNVCATQRRMRIQIIGLDTEETILKKIKIAENMLNGIEPMPSEELKNSDNLLDCLDGYFGIGPELDRQFFEAKMKEAEMASEQENNPSNEVVEENSQEVDEIVDVQN